MMAERTLTRQKTFYGTKYTECILTCSPSDPECLTSCSREYQINLETCPCRSGCPAGCPCPDYECPATTRDSHLDQ